MQSNCPKQLNPGQIDESHYHMKLMKLVRSCMSTSTPCIEAGVKTCCDQPIKQFSKMIAKLERSPKQHITLYETKCCDSFVSTKHGAFFLFKNMPSDGEVTVVFRQSYCKCNWITNLQWLPREQDGIHSGFHFLSTTIFEELKAAIDRAGEFMRIYFTGMSLGGAMCALMAYRMVTEGGLDPRKVEVVQFASPRVGLVDWASKYEDVLGQSSHHYHSTRDLFANSPPPRAGNYSHVGTQIFVGDFGYSHDLQMRAHTKILGLSFASGMNIPLAVSMVVRGDRILKSWEKIMALVDCGV